MADFSFLSDTDESAVEGILSQAADHVILKQISALNLSAAAAADDSILPHHLDARFRRLKTFPNSSQSPITSPPEKVAVNSDDPPPKLTDQSDDDHRLSPSPAPSSNSRWMEEGKVHKGFGPGPRSGSVSPPMAKNWGCLCCSPGRKISRKKSYRGGLNDGVLGELGVGSMSRRKQDKMMKKAVEEERKIARDADKIVEWALHASARMDAS